MTINRVKEIISQVNVNTTNTWSSLKLFHLKVSAGHSRDLKILCLLKEPLEDPLTSAKGQPRVKESCKLLSVCSLQRWREKISIIPVLWISKAPDPAWLAKKNMCSAMMKTNTCHIYCKIPWGNMFWSYLHCTKCCAFKLETVCTTNTLTKCLTGKTIKVLWSIP